MRRSETFAFLLLPFALAALAACALPHTPARVIYEDPANFVRVENDPTVFVELPHTLHSHPVSITPEQMAKILVGFTVRDHRIAIQVYFSGEAAQEKAFSKEEVELLAPRLSEALARAEPTERVIYYLSQPRSSIKREIITGALYVREGHLHFILGNYRVIYGIPSYGMVYDRRYPARPTAAKGFDLFFEPAEAIIPRHYSMWDQLMGRVKDEMVIDLPRLLKTQSVVQRGLDRDLPPN